MATDAYFWNEHGVVGSQNGLYPNHCLYGGLGRNFVSRHLVAATSLEDAIARATMGNQATGHSFNLASKYEERLVNIEVKPNVESSGSSGQVRSLSQSPYVITSVEKGSSLFHANCYIYMDADADCSTSSQHRMARASELPPAKSVQDVLVTLGDTEDKDYPIYRSGVGDDKDNGYTISTVLFHLGFENKTHASTSASDASVTIYLNNPKTHENIHFKYSTIEIV